jgi:hypothetical protein
MSMFTNHMMVAAASRAAAATTYSIDNSCMFDISSSTYMTDTLSTPTDSTNWTWSAWVKRSTLESEQWLFNAGADSLTYYVRFQTNDKIRFRATGEWDIETTGVFRDIGAWYHIVAKHADSGAVTLYVNNTVVGTATGASSSFFTNVIHSLGADTGARNYFGGYMAEVHGIDGQALSPSSFGETNTRGVWVPKEYSGTYGNNGFFIDFESSGDLGNDVSGNNNDFSTINITSSNQSTDTPTNNHCTWNATDNLVDNLTLSQGNKRFVNANSSQDKVKGTFFPTNGKWYWEVKWTATSDVAGGLVGISQSDVQSNHELGSTDSHGTGDSLGYRSLDGKTYRNSILADFGDSWDVGDVISVAMDLDNGFVYFGKNGTFQNSGDPTSGSSGTGAAYTISSTLVNGGGWGPAASSESSVIFDSYFAEAEWSYSAPANFLALNTTNLDAPVIVDPSTNFQVQLFTGTGSGLSVTNGGNSNMKPDIVWIKQRNKVDNQVVTDAARGADYSLYWNNSLAEVSGSGGVTSFNTDGFTLGTWNNVNESGKTAVAWQWNTGNTGSSNTDGSINTTTTYVDTTAGISISTYTGTGSAATVGHGLGVTPTTVWIFPRSNGDNHLASNWETGISVYSEQWKLQDTDSAESSANHVTAASSTTFTLGTDDNVNGSSRTYVAYAFVEVVGFSKFGTYTGNDETDGPYAFCGFSPEMVMIKVDTDDEDWVIFDRARDPTNPAENYLYPNANSEEATSSTQKIDFLSNGFKPRGTDNRINGNDTIHVFAAFAKHPFGGDGVAASPAVI